MNSSTSNSEISGGSGGSEGSARSARGGALAHVETAAGLAGDPRYLAWYLGCALVLVVALAAFNYGVDPLQYYRRAAAPVFIENQRYQNPGLARNYDYETVVVGTSHAENFEPAQLERVLGERSLKLAISGSSAREQRLTLELAIATGRVKHVIWILDHIAFKKPPDQLGTRAAEFPEHLYGAGLRSAGLYLLSLDSLRMSADALLGRGHRDLETLNSWHAQHEFSEARAIADWHRRGAILDRINLDPAMQYGSKAPLIRENLLENLVAPIREHPEIRFDLVFPPFSILSYLADHRTWPGAFGERQAYKAFAVDSTARLPNVRVFDFQGHQPITHDLDNYKDLEHYRLEVNDYVLRSLASGRHRVDPAGYAAVLAEQRRQVDAYRERACAPGSSRAELCPRMAGRAQPRAR